MITTPLSPTTGPTTTATGNTTGDQPDTHPTNWLPVAGTQYAIWSWAQIVAVITSSNEVTVAILGPSLPYADPILTWQMGVYSDTTGWPTCGLFYEGRLWLSGAVSNRIDSSSVDQPFNFAPTQPDGTVIDSNGISETFNSSDINTIYWMEPIGNGQFVCGTKGGEWLVQASTLGNPLTPASTQSHKVTKYGCANILPAHTPLTLAFAQKYGREVFEYFADVFSGKLVAPSMNTYAKHLTTSGIQELVYQAELAPVVWARVGNGQLVGCTYRRTSAFSSSEAEFVGWHHHSLGMAARLASSLVYQRLPEREPDTLITTTTDPSPRPLLRRATDPIIRQCERRHRGAGFWTARARLLAPSRPRLWEWPACSSSATPTSPTRASRPRSPLLAMISGLDCGDYTVAADGSVFVPYGSDPGGLFTLAYLQNLAAANPNGFGALSTNLDVIGGSRYVIPAVIGYTYTSQGQLLRSVLPQDAGAANGPAMGKTQRLHMFSALLASTQGISFGTSFTYLQAAQFANPAGTPYPNNQLFSGVWWDTIDSDYSFDEQGCWQVSRPYPATVVTFGGFLHTQDR